METLLAKNPKPQLSVWLESFRPSKRLVGHVKLIGLQVKMNRVKNGQFKRVENRFKPIGLLEVSQANRYFHIKKMTNF